VPSDAFEIDWTMLPLNMKRKLLVILQISTQRSLRLSVYGLSPLKKETFFAVSENLLIFHITYDSWKVIIEVWLRGSEPTKIRKF